MNDTIKKAVKDGLITQKQGANLPEAMVMGLIKKGGNAGMKASRGKKPKVRKKRVSTTYPKNKKDDKKKK
tara:strand:- start:460 stop:669 length:210 start_codon:yes stop_codon:yes gene_type:complete